jgi:two-component system chemotaxis response regulator CheB
MTLCDLVIVGASWGGLHAIGTILSGIPEGFAAPILAVQHRAEDGDDRLTGLLDRAASLPVCEVEDKMPIEAGTIYLAPPGYHVLVERGHLALSTGEQVRFSRPSLDVALESGADAYGAGLIGVVLTGANDDGAAGLAAVRRHGGIAIVQDPESSERSVMPAAARAAAKPHVVTGLEAIAPLLVELVGKHSARAT